MSDPAILFVKPRAIKPSDKTALRKAGVVVIEIDDPASVKFTRAYAELSGSQLLSIAAKALQKDDHGGARFAFANFLLASLAEEVKKP